MNLDAAEPAYNAKGDIQSFFGALADRSLSEVSPDLVHDTIRQMATHPDQTMGSLRLGKAVLTPQDIDDELTDMYFAEVARSDTDALAAMVDAEAQGVIDRWSAVSSRTGVDVSEVQSAEFDSYGGVGFNYDRLLAQYYAS